MKKIILNYKNLFICVFVMATLLSGCSESVDDFINDQPAVPITGTIYRIENEKILVVDGIEEVNIPYTKWFEQGRRAVFFSITDNTVITIDGNQATAGSLERGQKVEVYHEGILAESYPEQGGALKIIVTDSSAAETEQIDSGRFMEITEELTLRIKISGIPDELALREYALTGEAAEVAENLTLEMDEIIIIRHIPHDHFHGLIFDIERIVN